MKFQLKPILSEMKALYAEPVSVDRFQTYISKLQGKSKGDLALPIGGFNPMAKSHVLEKIDQLEHLETESVMEQTITVFNQQIENPPTETITVVLNLADDLKGGWTNFYSTDFDSKFKLNALVNRHFCVPYFWTSETYSKSLIQNRTLEYLKRTLYRQRHPQPITLEDHLNQEVFSLCTDETDKQHILNGDFDELEKYYSENKQTEDYDKIFHFFYGDQGSDSLGYKKYGLSNLLGFDYARRIKIAP